MIKLNNQERRKMKTMATKYRQDTLILENTSFFKNDNFYFELFRIPEVLNRLKQYKEILNENDIKIPFWVYNLTENFKIRTEGANQAYLTHFLMGLGLFDRYLTKQGWPKYIIGKDPFLSVILGESSFEDQILILSEGYLQESQGFQLYETSSYYNTSTGTFHLTGLTMRDQKASLSSLVTFIKENREEHWNDSSFQFLIPHNDKTKIELENLGVFAKDFLGIDSSLRWLWPIWKRSQIQERKKILEAKNRHLY